MRTAEIGNRVIVGFVDHDRRRYATAAPVAEAGEFNFALHLDGTPAPGGEFRMVLVDLGRDLRPQVRVFGDGADCLTRATRIGLLGLLAPVAGHAQFSRRSTAAGFEDLSDLELGEVEER